MNSTMTIGTWKEDICPDERIDFSTELFSELLEKINFSEKNNNKEGILTMWCEEVINDLPVELQDISFILQNYYEHAL